MAEVASLNMLLGRMWLIDYNVYIYMRIDGSGSQRGIHYAYMYMYMHT